VSNDAKFTNEYFCSGADTHTYFGISNGNYLYDTLEGHSNGTYSYDFHDSTGGGCDTLLHHAHNDST